MERSAPAAAATYIEDRLRRRGRSESQQDDAPASSSQGPAAGEPGGGSGGARGAGAGGDSGHFALLHHRPALFGAEGAALVSAGGRQLTQWKDTLLKKLKKVGVPHGACAPAQQPAEVAHCAPAADVASAAPCRWRANQRLRRPPAPPPACSSWGRRR